MHRALFIQELLVHICDFLHIDKDDLRSTCSERRVAKATLASLARTSRIFHDPAICFLWSVQTSLIPLILCLGDSVALVEKWPSGNPKLAYRQPPSAAQLSRFLKYAHSIKSIQLDYPPAIDTKVLDELLSLSWPPSISTHQRLVFFPNLITIKWDWLYVPSDYLSLLLGPSLKDLVLGMDADDVLMEFTLDAFKYHAPSLDKFTRRDTPKQSPLALVTWLGLNSFQNLTCVDLEQTYDMSSVVWIMLSQLPHLKEFKCRIPLKDYGGRPPLLPKTQFPSLTSLTVACDSEQSNSFERFLAEFMPVERRPYALRHLRLSNHLPFAEGDQPPYIQQMVDLCDPMVLTSFSYTAEHMYHRRSSDFTLTRLAPLLALRSLRIIELFPMGTIDLDNVAVEEMARAWPNLERLILPSASSFWKGTPRITLEGLVPLAQLCPRLWSISIAIDGHKFVSEQVQRKVDQMTFCNSVTDIRFNRGPLSNREGADGVAQFLMKLFPVLDTVTWPRETKSQGRNDSDPLMKVIWDHVDEIVQERILGLGV